MNSQSIIIYKFEELFNILKEIKSNINFKLFNLNDEKLKKDLNEKNFGNFLIIAKKNNNFEKIYPNINSQKCIVLENFPIKIEKLIEILNVKLLKHKYISQSEIILGQYLIDINSRIIKNKIKKIKLTEKEIDIILFLKSKKIPQKIEVLQKEVWGYASELETHTVETHVYRLRKKINDNFHDENFIISNKDGYKIN